MDLVGDPPPTPTLRSSLTALTATALAQHTPVAPPASPRPPRAFLRALGEGTGVWAEGTLAPVEADRSVGSAAPGGAKPVRMEVEAAGGRILLVDDLTLTGL